MKIQCDVCGKEEALVLCCADEAALCDACDRRVHCANILAGKHRRFSLESPSVRSNPLCDVCQEKRAVLFCRDDRAILCGDCDASIHSANHLTMNHSRFLLTGVRFAAAPVSAPEPVTAAYSTDCGIGRSGQDKALVADTVTATVSAASATSATANFGASSISDYLINMCPGWHVEDLLDDDDDDDDDAAAIVSMDGFSKVDELLPSLDADLDGGGGGGLETICAPHVPQLPPPGPPAGGAAHDQHRLGGNKVGINFRERSEQALVVPQSPRLFRLPTRDQGATLWSYH
ncbi:hypothetical protein B296_00049581 [Ensete ventricosum]|uniref:B box-type domain-containing protein n=1 Tax=Ensete ventricosum TaxID=4639 RepID=A0A426Y350_ENSVE|nr:hypothetical protein B296_00049581 [Ensete ventricosum]